MTQGPDQHRRKDEEAGAARTGPGGSSAASEPPGAPSEPGCAPSDPTRSPATPAATESSRLTRWRRRVSAAPLAVGGVAVLLATGVGFGAGFAVGEQAAGQVTTEGPDGGAQRGGAGEWSPGGGSEVPGAPGGGAGLPGLEDGATQDGGTSADEATADT